MKDEAEAVIAAYERALAEARQAAQATLKETTERSPPPPPSARRC